MAKYVIKRLVLLIPVMLGVAFIIFSIMNFIPGDPASLILGESAPAEAREQLNEELGMNDPFIVRFADYIGFPPPSIWRRGPCFWQCFLVFRWGFYPRSSSTLSWTC